jgi:hypothetical protein
VARVESRRLKRKTPLPLDLELLGEKETMLAEIWGVRERTLAFLEETHGRNLSAYHWRHPFWATSIFAIGSHSWLHIRFVIPCSW